MKFRDPKTGDVFEDANAAIRRRCACLDCPDCVLYNNLPDTQGCQSIAYENPTESARLMGYEVVEDDTIGEAQGVKSLFCEHIGVKPGQPFIVHGYPNRRYPPMVYGEDGCVRLYSPDGQRRHKVGGRAITWIVDHPESVEPCKGYTPQEVAFKKEKPMEKTDKPRICQVLGVEEFERICEAVHNGWWEEKKRQGVTDHPDMIPYGELAEDVKEYDRVTVRRVLDVLGICYESRPRFTEEEVAVLRHFAAAGVIKIKKGQNGGTMNWDADRVGGSMSIPDGFLPSLRPGQAVRLEEIIHATDR